eukprot:1157866-Pelagomonas_calceolata.AAC.6
MGCFQVTLSVVEIYCERIRCLLSNGEPGKDNLQKERERERCSMVRYEKDGIGIPKCIVVGGGGVVLELLLKKGRDNHIGRRNFPNIKGRRLPPNGVGGGAASCLYRLTRYMRLMIKQPLRLAVKTDKLRGVYVEGESLSQGLWCALELCRCKCAAEEA